MNDPRAIARYILASLPDDPSDVTEADMAKLTAAGGVFVRLYDEVTRRVEKAGTVKKLAKAEKQMARLIEAEAMLKPWVDRAVEIETEGPSL